MDTDTIKTKRRPPSFRRNTTTNFPISVIKGVEMKKKVNLEIQADILTHYFSLY